MQEFGWILPCRRGPPACITTFVRDVVTLFVLVNECLWICWGSCVTLLICSLSYQ